MVEKTIKVSLDKRSYSILIGLSCLSQVGAKIKSLVSADKVAIVTNPIVKELYSEIVINSLKNWFKPLLIEVPDGEEHKSLKVASKLYDELILEKVHRTDLIISLGGGVIGDLAGFVAATYMRGVPFVQIPTTLLAQVDSSVGGKVAVNHPKGKNLIGCFYQPQLVLIDVSVLRTLSERQVRAGFAEVIKCAFLKGEEFLSFLEENLCGILGLQGSVLIETVSLCCDFKARVVEEDERDISGRRAILNYGHTIGHAIEALSKYKEVLHGEAVATGLVCEAFIAQELGLIDDGLVERHIEIIKKAGFSLDFSGLEIDEILKQITLDKKATGEANVFVLLKDLGKPTVLEVPDEAVRAALNKVRRL